MKICADTCNRNPKECPFAFVDEDGSSYYSGLPIRIYRPGEDCPMMEKEKDDD